MIIEHNMDVALQVASRITVLAFGGSVCGGESRGDPEQYAGSGDLLWSRGMRGSAGKKEDEAC